MSDKNMTPVDAALEWQSNPIACSSATLRILADEVRRLRKEADKWRAAAKENADACIGISKDFAAFKACHDEWKARAEKAEAEAAALREDKARLDWLNNETPTLRLNSSPIADTGDASQRWEVIVHHMTPKYIRVIGWASEGNLRADISIAEILSTKSNK